MGWVVFHAIGLGIVVGFCIGAIFDRNWKLATFEGLLALVPAFNLIMTIRALS
jgi:hypothetical protein